MRTTRRSRFSSLGLLALLGGCGSTAAVVHEGGDGPGVVSAARVIDPATMHSAFALAPSPALDLSLRFETPHFTIAGDGHGAFALTFDTEFVASRVGASSTMGMTLTEAPMPARWVEELVALLGPLACTPPLAADMTQVGTMTSRGVTTSVCDHGAPSAVDPDSIPYFSEEEVYETLQRVVWIEVQRQLAVGQPVPDATYRIDVRTHREHIAWEGDHFEHCEPVSDDEGHPALSCVAMSEVAVAGLARALRDASCDPTEMNERCSAWSAIAQSRVWDRDVLSREGNQQVAPVLRPVGPAAPRPAYQGFAFVDEAFEHPAFALPHTLPADTSIEIYETSLSIRSQDGVHFGVAGLGPIPPRWIENVLATMGPLHGLSCPRPRGQRGMSPMASLSVHSGEVTSEHMYCCSARPVGALSGPTEHGCREDSIDRAAAEMRERVARLVDAGQSAQWVAASARGEPIPPASYHFVMYDESGAPTWQVSYATDHFESCDGQGTHCVPIMREAVAAQWRWLREEGIDPAHVTANPSALPMLLLHSTIDVWTTGTDFSAFGLSAMTNAQ